MTSLVLPTPQLQWDAPGPFAEIESPVTVRLAAPAYDDGTVPATDDLTVGVFVYRTMYGAEEIWNETEQSWRPPPPTQSALALLPPVPLAFQAGKTPPWRGVLMAAGATDAAGAARFARAVAGVPTYRLRAWAQAKRAGIAYTALSPPSVDLQFVAAADNQRFTVDLDTGSARTAERVTILLKNAALQKVGSVEIHAGGSNEVTISNLDDAGNTLARVRLSASGDIRLEPGSGSSVIVAGRLQANEVVYQPGGTGLFQTL